AASARGAGRARPRASPRCGSPGTGGCRSPAASAGAWAASWETARVRSQGRALRSFMAPSTAPAPRTSPPLASAPAPSHRLLPLPNPQDAFYQRPRPEADAVSEAARDRRRGDAGAAFRIVMGLGLLLTLAANVPGQMSLDSVVALIEARTGVRQTWAPAVSSWLLKPFNHLVGGTGLYVTASAALLFFSLMSLTRLRPRSTWLAVALGAAAILTPQILLYQGIVWRDVAFANLTLAGFVALAHAAKAWGAQRSPPVLPLAGALVCLALAALARQNGLILVVAAAAALAWTARGAGWRASLGWGLGALVATGLLAFAINRAA